MKHLTLLQILAIASLTIALLLLAGCAQIIVEPHRVKINTLFTTSVLEDLYIDKDPNGIMEVSRYRGRPADVDAGFNPITKTVNIKSKSNLERK